MHYRASSLESEYFENGIGFQVIDPFGNEIRETRRPQAPFLKRGEGSFSAVIAKAMCPNGVVVTPAQLTRIDKGELKPNVFHKLWIAGL